MAVSFSATPTGVPVPSRDVRAPPAAFRLYFLIPFYEPGHRACGERRPRVGRRDEADWRRSSGETVLRDLLLIDMNAEAGPLGHGHEPVLDPVQWCDDVIFEAVVGSVVG